MKTTFKAEIIWDTKDEVVTASAVEDFVKHINERYATVEAVKPPYYPETPIVLIIKNKL